MVVVDPHQAEAEVVVKVVAEVVAVDTRRKDIPKTTIDMIIIVML